MKTPPNTPFVSHYDGPYVPLTHHPIPHIRRRYRQAVKYHWELAVTRGYISSFRDYHVHPTCHSGARRMDYNYGILNCMKGVPGRDALCVIGEMRAVPSATYVGVLMRLAFDNEAKRWAACVKASPETRGLHPTVKDAETGNPAWVDPTNPARPASLDTAPLINFDHVRTLCEAHADVRRKPFERKSPRRMNYYGKDNQFRQYDKLRYVEAHTRRENLSSPMPGAAGGLTASVICATTLRFTVAATVRNTLGTAAMVRLLCEAVQLGGVTNYWLYPSGDHNEPYVKQHWLLRQVQHYALKFHDEGRFPGPDQVSRIVQCLPDPRPLLIHAPKDHDEMLPLDKYSYLRYPYDGIVRGMFSVSAMPSLLTAVEGVTANGISSDQRAFAINAIKKWATPLKFTLHILNNDDEQWGDDAPALQEQWRRLYSTDAEAQAGEPFRSCMRDSRGPMAYGLPGNHLGLAYVVDGDAKLVGRTVVRLDRKEYVRLFNFDFVPMDRIIQRAGFKRGDLDGIELAVIQTSRYSDKYYMPYLDSSSHHVERCGDVWVIGDDGIEAQNTSGTITEKPECCCDCCGDPTDEEDLQYSDFDDQQYCSGCIDDGNIAWVIHRRGSEVLTRYLDDTIECVSDGRRYTEQGAEWARLVQCALTDRWYADEDTVTVTDAYGEEVSVYSGHHWVVQLEYEDDNGHDHGIKRDGAVQLYDGTWCHQDNAVQCCITGDVYHESDTDNIVKLAIVGRKSFWVSLEALRKNPEKFVLCGTPVKGYRLLPALYYGHSFGEAANAIDLDEVGVDIINADEGDPTEVVAELINELQGATA